MDNQNQPRETISRQDVNMPANGDDLDDAVYAGLGVNNEPDVMNPGSDEATDTILHTDTFTAQHAADEVPDGDDPTNILLDKTPENADDDELDREITELAKEKKSNEGY